MKWAMTTLLLAISCSVWSSNQFGIFSESQVCKAGIATSNGRSPKTVRLLGKQGDTVTVGYKKDDGEITGYRCRVEGDEIRWRDQSTADWNSDIRLYYSLGDAGARLNIRTVMLGEETLKSFVPTDF